jgi:molybdopterin adenylyltransferase
MSSSTPERWTAAVITVSDSSSSGQREDVSGPAVVSVLEQNQFQVVARETVADDQTAIETVLLRHCSQARFVVTTGGTGIAARDVTPEATVSICEKLVPGIAERMRIEGSQKTKLAALSRAVCGTRGESLILNLPGSPKGAVESLQAVIDLVPHALKLLGGDTRHS